jgi:hypothetical protein
MRSIFYKADGLNEGEQEQTVTYPTTRQAVHPPPVARRDRFSGFPTASLALGIVGAVFSVVPYLDVLTMLGAIVGLVLGGIALFGPRKLAAGFGVGLSVLAVMLTSLVMDAVTSATSDDRSLPQFAYPSATLTNNVLSAEPPLPPGPFSTIGDGTALVGLEIRPGTYRTAGPTPSVNRLCVWQRLRDTSGELSAVMASDVSSGPAVVTISAADTAFKSTGCQTWRKID